MKLDVTTIKAGAKEFLVTPTYEKCKGFGSLPVTITHNGCEYRVYDLTTINKAEDKYSYKVDLVCPAGKVVETHVYANETAEKEGKSVCTMTAGSQNNIPQEAENWLQSTTTASPPDIDWTTTLKEIKYILHSESLIICGKAAGTTTELGDKKYTGSTTIKGYEDVEPFTEYGTEGNQIGIQISHK